MTTKASNTNKTWVMLMLMMRPFLLIDSSIYRANPPTWRQALAFVQWKCN
jgi:hypothetical protein